MTIAANIGDVAIMNFEACFPDSMVGLVPVPNVRVEFLYYVLKSLKVEFLRIAPVSTQANLNVNRIGTMFIAVPPLKEQALIIAAVDKELEKNRSLINRAQREIELLREYRTVLVADVATGKLDVRGVDLLAIEEVEELESIETDEELEAEALDESEEPAYADD